MKLPCDMSPGICAADLIAEAEALTDALPTRDVERQAAYAEDLQDWARAYWRGSLLRREAGEPAWSRDLAFEAEDCERIAGEKNYTPDYE